DQKLASLRSCARILGAEIFGADTHTREDFAACAREAAEKCDVLVVAGGDGTFSDVINAVDTRRNPVAYLPFGSGNSLRYALGCKGNLAAIANRILKGSIRSYDLIICDNRRRAFMVSVGLEGTVLKLRKRYLARGTTGLSAYLKSALRAYFKHYQRLKMKACWDGASAVFDKVLTLMIFKQPYYGYGMRIIPRARFDDGKLHVLCATSGLILSLIGVGLSFLSGNPTGRYFAASRLSLHLDMPTLLQVDGNEAWTSDTFSFSVAPGALRIKC
ncbi:MAG: NAD(+)/NADH kinase, partial [Deltaproteobacteria bacterium]|nr:NAD(+)/NADH kinase [Deltaproteobacteria bacterium]